MVVKHRDRMILSIYSGDGLLLMAGCSLSPRTAYCSLDKAVKLVNSMSQILFQLMHVD